jgi:hypothetical protein
MTKESKDSLRLAFSSLVKARESASIRFGPFRGQPASEAVASFQAETGKILPGEYIEFIDIFNGETGEPSPFFFGAPFISFNSARDEYLGMIKYPPYEANEYFGFSEREGAGLYVKFSSGHEYDAPLYYRAHGIGPELRFRSINRFLESITECLKNGLPSIITKFSLGDERKTEDKILRRYL